MNKTFGLVKAFLIVLFFIFIFVFLFSLLIPSRVVIVKSVSISKPSEQVMGAVSDLKTWKNWHPAFADSIYNRPEFFADSILWYQEEKLNKLVVKERSPLGLRFNIVTTGEKEIENIISVASDSASSITELQWTAVIHLKWYPWEKFAGIFTEKINGPGYEIALLSLKKYLESPKPEN